MRVLVVTHYFAEHRGGIETVAREIAIGLAGRGHAVTWAASAAGVADPPDGVTRLPVAAWNVTERAFGFPYPFWGPTGLARLAAAVRRADVVHVHDCLYVGSVAGALAAGAFGKPFVVTQHVGWVPFSAKALRGTMSAANHVLGRLVLGRASRCVFVSQRVRSYFGSLVRLVREPAFIPNGVSFDRFRPLPEPDRARLRRSLGWDGPVALFVGRFVEKKGLPHVRRLAAAFPECRFILVGWGPLRPETWRLPNVRCVGSLGQAEIVPYYQAADLLLLPSVGEGFPLVLQESMACGTPVLISDETAQAFDLVREVAFVGELEAAALERTFRSVLAAPRLLHARRATAAAFAREHWSWTATVDAYEAVLQEAVGTTRATGPRASG